MGCPEAKITPEGQTTGNDVGRCYGNCKLDSQKPQKGQISYQSSDPQGWPQKIHGKVSKGCFYTFSASLSTILNSIFLKIFWFWC
jgi:hypothetical protein